MPRNDTLTVVHFCPESRPYAASDVQGREILPCCRSDCESADGTPRHPRTRICANAGCGVEFHSDCSSVIYCSERCFRESGSEAAWVEASRRVAEELIQQQRKEKAKATKKEYLASPRGKEKKRGQNDRFYAGYKHTEKNRQRIARRKAKIAAERALKQEAEREAGDHRRIRKKGG